MNWKFGQLLLEGGDTYWSVFAAGTVGKTCLPCNMGGMPTSDSWDRDKDGKCCMKVEDILGIVDKVSDRYLSYANTGNVRSPIFVIF